MALVSPIYRSHPKPKKRTPAQIFQLNRNRHPSRSERLAWRVLKRLGFERNQILFGYPVSFIHRLKKLIIAIGEPTRLPVEYLWRQAGYKILWFAWGSNLEFQIPVALTGKAFFDIKEMLATALRCRKVLVHLSLSMPPECLPQTSGTRMAYIAKTRLTGACLV